MGVRETEARGRNLAEVVKSTELEPFDRVIDEHGPAVLRFCIARAGHAAEDVFQDTMLAALRGYSELRDPAAVLGWLFSIALRKAIDASRAQRRVPLPGGTAQDIETMATLHAGSASPIAGSGGLWPSPMGDLLAVADDATWSEVRSLPVKQRQAVTLRYLADLTHAEVAAVMQTSEPAARRNVFEGLRRLREVMDRG